MAHQAPLSMGFSRQEYWSGLLYPTQGIFLTQGSNPILLYYRQIIPTLCDPLPLSAIQNSETMPFVVTEMIISRSIHVTANGIVSFFWLIIGWGPTRLKGLSARTHTHTHNGMSGRDS